jgi:alpha-L-fucosidase 2
MGGLLWGEGDTLRLSLDRGDLWDTRTPEMLQREDWTWATLRRLKEAGDHKTMVEMFDVPYDRVPYPTKLPVGRLEFTLPAGTTIRSFTLDLAQAEGRVDLGGERVEAFYSATADVAMLRFDGPEPEVRIVRPDGLDKLGYGPAKFTDEPGPQNEPRIRRMVQPCADAGAYVVMVWSKRIGDRTEMAVCVRGTNEDLRTADEAEFSAMMWCGLAIERGYDVMLTHHRKWWSEFWQTSSVSIPDPALQHHYDLVKYFYGAASARGAPPIPLQGVWTADNGDLPPWKGDYHNDLNTQMTYLAYFDAGLFEQGESWLRFNSNLLPTYRDVAKRIYGLEEGAVIPGVMTIDGKPMGGWAMYSLSPTNGAWIAQSFYLHWQYTRDDRFLRERAYPFCSEIATALHTLAPRNEAGVRRLPLSSSPEIYDNSLRAFLPPNSSYDLALMRFIFAACAEMADAMDDAAAAKHWREALAELEPLDVEPATGSLTFARGLPYDESHRHFSHAMAVHPLGLVDVHAGDGQRSIVEGTIAQIDKHGTQAWVGYSFSWFACMCARAGQSDRVLDYLTKYLCFTGRNGFHLNGDQSGRGLSGFTYRPFTLEGNFLAMQAVHEMLIQSHGRIGEANTNTLRIFPATPEAWNDVSFRDLRAQGGWKVSATRRGGKTVRVEITADPGCGVLRLHDPFGSPSAKWSKPPTRIDDTYTFELKAGETLVAEHFD